MNIVIWCVAVAGRVVVGVCGHWYERWFSSAAVWSSSANPVDRRLLSAHQATKTVC